MTTQIRELAAGPFRGLEAGEGPVALLLHGFPDHPRTFRHQLPALAAAGFRAVAPYMRGYGPGGPPADGRYDVAALAEDAVALLDALDAPHACIFGHDWGAMAAYFTALAAKNRVRRLATAAVPYGPALVRALQNDYAQQKRSWYMVFFQHALAERAVAANDFAFLDGLWRDWSPGYTLPVDEMAALKETFRRPGVLSAALGYYRATMAPAFDDPAQAEAMSAGLALPLDVPGLMIHGADDGCMGVDLLAGMGDYFPRGLRTEVIRDAGHFVHQERAEVVNRLLVEFFRG
jgi:pimeloyl-ACP methyl ester carboxylesterase